MKFIQLIFLILLISRSVFAQKTDYSVLTIPEELKKDANDVVRMDYTRLVVSSKEEATLHFKYAVTLMNSNSRKNVRHISYDKNIKINGLSARIYDAYGKPVKSFDKNDFTDQSAIDGSTIYSDNRVKFIELSHSSYPYTVEFEYQKTFKGILYYPDCYIQDFNSSLENLNFIVEMPSELELLYKAKNIDIEPEINKNGKITTYQWIVQNRPAFKSEDFMPSPDQILPYIQISPRVFQYGHYKGEATSWQSLGQFFYDLNKGRDALSPEMAAMVKELTAGLKTNQEKIEVLYRYLQENTRYVSVQLGIGGWQTFEAGYVEKNKYGDCKALSNFMLSLLKEAGISTQLAIIYRDEESRTIVDENFPALFGNHMLLYVPSEDIWLECTSNHYPVNYLGASNDNRSVLLLTTDGGKLTTSPVFNPSDNTQFSTAEITIADDGSAGIVSTIFTKGPKHEIYREIEHYLTNEDFKEYFLQSSDLPAFNIEKLEVKSQKDIPEAQLDYTLTVKSYATNAGKRLFIPLNKINAFDDVPPPTDKRIHPVEIIRGYREVDDVTFKLPEAYEVESIPEAIIDIQTDYGKYASKIEFSDSTLTYHRTLEVQAVKLPPGEYDQFRDFYKEIAKADGMKIVLVKKKT